MAQYKTGNMFHDFDVTDKTKIYLVTTNSKLRKDGCLVMGRGAAKELLTYTPEANKIFGEMINKECGSMGVYGVLLNHTHGAFQVKLDWADEAQTGLIRYSVQCLNKWVKLADHIQEWHLNFPGIGNGKLTKAEVLPLLHDLSDKVTVWEM